MKDSPIYDVLVGGGNAALCAALTAAEGGASVLLLESAPKEWRGGNSVHTRNLRCMHDAPQDVLVEAYPEEEFWQDLLKVTGGITNEHLARLVIRSTATCRDWMRKHGVNFQNSLSGTLHVARTNAFFMGGGKALVNAYFRSAERMGITVRYNAPVDSIELDNGRFIAAYIGKERIAARSCVLAAGGFESNRKWLREAWGQNEHGEWPADNFLIRGTRYNQGVLLRHMLDAGADAIGDPSQSHCVAIDARAPEYDGGICTRIDCVSLGIVVNREAERFYDEGEDFWPKRYAIWGRLVAQQPGQIAYSIIDRKAVGNFMPPVFPGTQADSLPELADKVGLDKTRFMRTVSEYNAACSGGKFDHTILDGCHTNGLAVPKTNWARPIATGPFYAYPLRPGITFTYLGLKVNDDAAVHFNGQPSDNLFVAGEMMAGNVLGKSYTAGVGMSIGTAFGRIAGDRAAAAALNQKNNQTGGQRDAACGGVAPTLGLLTADETEVDRILQICNACRYCEGFCAVFPAMTRRLEFGKADINYLSNLCHNCGDCLHACQYAPPHEFAVNVPQAMAKVRAQTYSDYAWPPALGALYKRNGLTVALATAGGLILFLLLALAMTGSLLHEPLGGNFYAIFPHNLMALMFGTVFGFAVLALGIGVTKFWREITPGAPSGPAIAETTSDVLRLRYLDGGHGKGCNNEDDAFTLWRKRFHHFTFYGFMLCFAATSVATLYHYLLGLAAPYPLLSLPVILGTLGGIGLLIGPAGLLWLNFKRHPLHGDDKQKPMDRGFIALLFLISLTGLLLLGLRDTSYMALLLAVHLGFVMALFLTMPYGKFAHGIFRSAALLKWSIEKRQPLEIKLGAD